MKRLTDTGTAALMGLLSVAIVAGIGVMGITVRSVAVLAVIGLGGIGIAAALTAGALLFAAVRGPRHD